MLTGGLVAALLVGAIQIYGWVSPSPSLIVYDAGRVVAAGELDYVLDDPSQGGGASGITAGGQFAGESGEECRRFAQGYLSGIACFQNGQWHLMEMTQANPPSDEQPAEVTAPPKAEGS